MALLSPNVVHAQTAVAPSFFVDEPAAEIALTALVGLTHLAYLAPYAEHDWAPAWALPRDDGYGLASDFTGNIVGFGWQLAGGYGLEVGYYDRQGVPDAMELGLRTLLIDLQAFVLATGTTAIIKHVSGRCRPRDWDGERCDPDAKQNAFPSGHVVAPASVAGVHLTLAVQTGDDPSRRYVAFGVAEAATLATAALRMAAGAHSWEDVLVGVLIGHAAGVGMALAHPVERVGGEGGAPQPPGLSFEGDF